MVRIKVIGGPIRSDERPVRIGTEYEFIYDTACAQYDWLVVYDELPQRDTGTYHDGFEPLACPQERTILCTWEPISIKVYSRAYTRQFGYLLTNRPRWAERHPNYRLGRGYFRPFVHEVPLQVGSVSGKDRVVSAVCSAKQMKHTRHYDRYRLVKRMAAEVPGLDWYGRGVRAIDRKEDALLPYKYHIAVENHIGVHHWTEKFSDAILCECLPFYGGDPALTEIFPKDCFIPIPIDDPAEAVRIVKTAIESNEYEKRREAILEAKRLILSKYNFYAQVISVIQSAGTGRNAPFEIPETHRIYARKELRKRSIKVALTDAFLHLKQYLGLNCYAIDPDMKDVVWRVDMAFSLGFSCGGSHALRRANAQFASYPMDWTGSPGIVQSARMVASDFAGWLERDDLELVDVRAGRFGNRIYRSRKTRFGFPHEFSSFQTFDELYALVVEKHRRRIERLMAHVRSSKRVLVIYIERPINPRAADADLLEAKRTLEEKFPGVAFSLVYFFHTDGAAVARDVAPNVTAVDCAYRQVVNGEVWHEIDYERVADWLLANVAVTDPRLEEEKAAYVARCQPSALPRRGIPSAARSLNWNTRSTGIWSSGSFRCLL